MAWAFAVPAAFAAMLHSPAAAAWNDPGRASIAARADPDVPRLDAIDSRNVHNVGNIWLNITNFGLLGSQPGTNAPWSEAPSAQWPAGSGIEYLWSAGLWVGALVDGEPHVSTAQVDMEFRPERGPLGRLYRSSEGSPGGKRAPAFDQDDDGDGRIDEDALDGRDNDGDGRIDEDHAAISNQMFVCEYNDFDPVIRLSLPDHRPLGLVVRQTSMAWDDVEKRDWIAFKLEITTNRREFPEQIHVGLFADPDIGPNRQSARGFDDLVGFWEGDVPVWVGAVQRNVKVSLGYMWDADGDATLSEGYVGFAFLGVERTGYGTNAMNRRVHALEVRNFRSFAGRAAFQAGGDPTNDEQRFMVLNGTAPGSLQGAPGGRTAPASRIPNDYRFVLSTGPFGTLTPGDTLGITAALVIGRGFGELQQVAARAQLAFDGIWVDCDHDSTTGVDGRETPHCGPEETGTIYPIRGPDSNDQRFLIPCDPTCQDVLGGWWRLARCAVQVPADGCIWIDGDCDPSTGVDGAECLVHWYTGVAPPPPSMRLVAAENRVDVLFDNRSERVADPLLDVSDFESYRIWRADDWTRPLGSGVDTGPDPKHWKLMAEYDRRTGIGQDTGLEDLEYTPRVPQHYVEFCREWLQAHAGERPPLLPGFTEAQLDTAIAMANGVRYHRWVDPGFIAGPHADDPPCGLDGACDPIETGSEVVYRRCDRRRRCRATFPPPATGAHYFYSVTATDHQMERRGAALVPTAPGLVGSPQTNFLYVQPPSGTLPARQFEQAEREIYVVPNPATRSSIAGWALDPNNDDPTGIKIEFHHLPAAVGRITVFTLSGDRVQDLPFDCRTSDGTVRWDLVSRNNQEVTSGVYLFVVEADAPGFERFVGKFVVVR